jgi:outer membrane biogenesis lipoprotein LolB
LFTDDQIDADLDRLEAGQQEDGGWTVDFLQWSPGQALEWRGIATVNALAVLRANGRLTS